MRKMKDEDTSLDEGSSAAQEMLDLMLDRAESQQSPIDFWRGFLHTLHGALVLEMGEAELFQTLRDTINVIPGVVAKHRGETETH